MVEARPPSVRQGRRLSRTPFLSLPFRVTICEIQDAGIVGNKCGECSQIWPLVGSMDYTWCTFRPLLHQPGQETRVLACKCPPLPGDPAVPRLTPWTLDQIVAFCLVPGLLTATGPGQDLMAVHRAALFSGCLARPRHDSLAQVLASSYICKGAWISHTGQ